MTNLQEENTKMDISKEDTLPEVKEPTLLPSDLPLSITSEIIKRSIDEDICLSKSTKIAFSRLGGVFILFISQMANEICKSNNRTKIMNKDVISAMDKYGFSNYKNEINELLEKLCKPLKEKAQKRKDVDENIKITNEKELNN